MEKILNSSVIGEYMFIISKPYRDNWRAYSKIFLEKIRIPILNKDEIEKLRMLSKKEEIDEFVLWLYEGKRKGYSNYLMDYLSGKYKREFRKQF